MAGPFEVARQGPKAVYVDRIVQLPRGRPALWSRVGSPMDPVRERPWIAGPGLTHSDVMSDQSEAAVAPVEAFEPPYYVAVFTAVPTEDRSGYGETNARMEDLVKEVPGYLGADHAQTPGGCPSPSGTSVTRRPSPSGGAMPSTVRRRSVGEPSGIRATRCMWRRWSGVTGSSGRRSRKRRYDVCVSSVSRSRTRRSISSRIGRTAATPWPAGSGSCQSR